MGVSFMRSSVQKRVLKAWRGLLWDFTKREWSTAFVWSGLGILCSVPIRVLLWNDEFRAYVTSKNKPVFDSLPLYATPLITAILIALVGSSLLRTLGTLRRGLRSWWCGVTSGLTLLPFLSAAVLFTFLALTIKTGFIALAIVAILFSISFMLYLRAKIRIENAPLEDELRVSSKVRSLSGTQMTESDDPIQSWAEDTIGRAALVDSICVKLLISKSPLLALFGEFGSGKTSTLNLLREHLARKAIVVSFSTWLPGSQETLTAYLLNDIANECSKEYVVPGLRKSARRLAEALGRNVPVLKSYLELRPAATQRDGIDNVKVALARLPKRVIVLLDELDRMDKEELVSLLKVIRGISNLPNLSFVCAGDRKTIVRIVKGELNDENNAYFEKFFPSSIQIPNPNPPALRKAGVERIVNAFKRRGWFENEFDEENLRKQLDVIWDERIAPFCPNLRAIGLLANEVGIAAAPLKHEVDALDLTLISLLRIFKPIIYEIVSRNTVALTGGEDVMRGGAYHSDEDQRRIQQELLADINQAAPQDERLPAVKGVLSEMFPAFRTIDSQSWESRKIQQEPDEDRPNRIRQPGIFPAYFRHELPEAIFSSAELNTLLRKVGEATNDAGREQEFMRVLDSMEKGSLVRDDFLRKMADAAKESIPLPIATTLLHAAMKAAHKYTYDLFPQLGEAGHVLRMVIRVAQRTPQPKRTALIWDCILEATDDTMAYRVLTILPRQIDADPKVTEAELYPKFVERMRTRYGTESDAANIDLSNADDKAFRLWGSGDSQKGMVPDPEDRKIQQDFWLRYIGQSRARLAQAFRQFLLPNAVYEGDPFVWVESKISVAELKRLYDQLPEDESLTSAERTALRVLRRFLDGEFKSGIGMHEGGLYAEGHTDSE